MYEMLNRREFDDQSFNNQNLAYIWPIFQNLKIRLKKPKKSY